MTTTTLTDHKANFEELAAVIAATTSVTPDKLRRHIDGLKAIEPTPEFYGEYSEAAGISIAAAVSALEKEYAVARVAWQANLDNLVKAVTIKDDEINPGSGPDFLSALHTLEESKAAGFKEQAFGDLMEEAVRVQDEGIANYRKALAKCAVMISDPSHIPDEPGDIPLHILELALSSFKSANPSLNVFFGDEAMKAEADRLRPLSIKKQEALIVKAKARDEAATVAQVEGAIEHRDESEHRHRVDDASLTTDERAARNRRAIEAADSMYLSLRRLTEIAQVKESEGLGLLDANGLMEVVQQAQVLCMRVEGRLN